MPRSPTRPALLAALALLLALAPPGCRRADRDSDKASYSFSSNPLSLRYADATAASGIDFLAVPQDDTVGFGHGVAVADIDGDGDLDLFFPQDRGPCALYRNDGGFRFTEVAAAAGVVLPGPEARAKAAAFLDFDRDGDEDLFVGTLGAGNHLFRNRGDGTFEDVGAASGLGGGTDFTVHAAVGDFDGDGFPDLYLCSFLPGLQGDFTPPPVPPAPNRLWRNDGDGTFTEVAAAKGVDDPRASWAATWIDLDGDGLQDLVVADDHDMYGGLETRDRAYVNQGPPDFLFVDRAAELGLDESHAGMGIAAGDLDGDGSLDLYTTDFGPCELRLTGAAPPWPDAAPGLGLEAGLAPDGRKLIGWGAAIADLNADGRMDLLVAHGTFASTGPPDFPDALQRPSLFLARPDGGFKESAESAGLVALGCYGARCAVPADLDGDGDLDLVFSTRVGAAKVVRNDRRLRSDWYGVRLRGTRSNTDGLGARLELAAGDRRVVDLVTGGGQPGGSLPAERILTPGPGAARPARLTVRWPSGTVQEVEPARDAWTVVTEPP